MTTLITPRTLTLVFILATFSVGYTYAHNKVVVIPMGADAGATSFAVFASGDQSVFISTTDVVVRGVTISAPVAGVVIVNSSHSVGESTEGFGVNCSITTGTIIDGTHLQRWRSGGNLAAFGAMSATRGFNILGGQSITYNLVCVHHGTDDSRIRDASLTAIFTPAQ